MNKSNYKRQIRSLLVLYFWLLIFEGAIRKWLLPEFAGPLLLIRDPVAIAIYGYALAGRIFPKGFSIALITMIAFLSLFAGFVALPQSPLVVMFGFQADFLQIPLLYIVPRVFNQNDLKTLGYWTLMLAGPMALLSVAQFHATPDSWLNAGAGAGAGQISEAQGHSRASGTFSFVTGLAAYYALVTAFVFEGMLSTRRYPLWLINVAIVSTLVVCAVAGSRELLVSVGLVAVLAVLYGMFIQPKMIKRSLAAFGIVTACFLVTSSLPIFTEGTGVMSARINNIGQAEGGLTGTFQNRVLNNYTAPVQDIDYAKPLGEGLGLGTLGGAALVGPDSGTQFTGDFEMEWNRIINESGPALGGAFILFRIYLTVGLGLLAIRAGRNGDALPLMLFAACFTQILDGPMGQATTAGFACLVGGMCYASAAHPTNSSQPAEDTLPMEKSGIRASTATTA